MKNIVLIGFMGTGKTTVGRIMSRKLKYLFFDTDYYIEEKSGISVAEIFKKFGEQYFRTLESQAIYEISQKSDSVISCGGGAVKLENNIKNLKKNGILICLKADIDTIICRTSMDKEKRPLLYNKSKDDIKRLMLERESLYSCADYFIDTTYKDPNSIADLIIDYYKKSLS